EENYYLSDWLIDPATGHIGGTNTFNFQPDFETNMPAPPILDQTGPQWVQQDLSSDADDIPLDEADFGLILSDDFTRAELESGVKNLYGAPVEAGMLYYVQNNSTNLVFQELDPGVPVSVSTNYDNDYNYASWCSIPGLDLVNYYMAPIISPYGDSAFLPPGAGSSGGSVPQPYPLPIDQRDNYTEWWEPTAAFNVTNQTPAVMFGSVGQPMILGAWAKYLIEGSSPAKYAYLGQYFTTNAFEVDSNGNMTTNVAGIVSPYGEFFPTQPGPAALITMTNLDTGTQATGIVNVISLALDANHDGTVDPTWNGPDMTSASAPYVFWANNNLDRWDIEDNVAFDETDQDDVLPGDATDPSQNLDPDDSDCNYTVNGQREIPGTRDLEDFARLWICGISSNVLAALPPGCTISLNWGDIGNPNPNNPTIDLFPAADPNGGMGYLTNETIATAQINPLEDACMGRIGPGSNLVLNVSDLWPGNYFIWCGVSNGEGGLNLTITGPNSNVLAQTTAYIQIVDIKQMYERWTAGDDSSVAPLTTAQLATNDLPAGMSQPFRYVNPPAASTPYILLVHGYNMEAWEKDRYAEAAFKRLYWQGYQGRFGDFHWPTATYALGFGGSEIQAWNSAQGLLNKLNDLDSQYPGRVYLAAHSLGNVVAGEALRLAGSNQVVNTYVAMQGAVSSHAYDPNTPSWFPTPDAGESDSYANYYDLDSPCYFNASKGAGTYINFYNTNDWALRVAWLAYQDVKPVTALGYGFSPPSVYTADIGLDRLYFPGDTYTIFSYVLQSQSYALGMQPGVGGVFSTNKQVSLPTVWPADLSGHNYGDHLWHSAEFRSDNPQRWLFWDETLVQMGLKGSL
ncbi:MAG: hypothetical protein ACREE6_07860, partial [Limisphaerales bacterium]